jgi:hypothetical protein
MAAKRRSMIELSYWTTPNGHKITIFLEEAGLPYRFQTKSEAENCEECFAAPMSLTGRAAKLAVSICFPSCRRQRTFAANSGKRKAA